MVGIKIARAHDALGIDISVYIGQTIPEAGTVQGLTFRTSFILLRVGRQALLSKGLTLDNCKHSRINSRFTKISKRPILSQCLEQDEHDMDSLKNVPISL